MQLLILTKCYLPSFYSIVYIICNIINVKQTLQYEI